VQPQEEGGCQKWVYVYWTNVKKEMFTKGRAREVYKRKGVDHPRVAERGGLVRAG